MAEAQPLIANGVQWVIVFPFLAVGLGCTGINLWLAINEFCGKRVASMVPAIGTIAIGVAVYIAPIEGIRGRQLLYLLSLPDFLPLAILSLGGLLRKLRLLPNSASSRKGSNNER